MLDYGSLAQRWWQWAAAIPRTRNPVADPTGAFAGENQPDDVWFLAGSFGEKIRRTCTVPAGRPLFFPLVNSYRGTFLLFGLRPPVLPQASGYAELDGTRLPSQVVVNRRAFELTTPPGSPMRGGDLDRFKVRAWGIWASVDHLAPGEHHLVIHGEEGPGGFCVDVAYELRAE